MTRTEITQEISRLEASIKMNESLVRNINNSIAENKSKIEMLRSQLNSTVHLKGSSRPDIYK